MWHMPSHLPDLRRHNIIGIDLETNDEGLRADLGSSWPWRGGYICGISVAWHGENGIQGEYVPLRHPDSENVPIEVATRWLADLIASDVRIVTQNGLYDWGWIRADLGLSMPKSDRLEEIGALATMIDEDRYDYRLDLLAAWRGLPGKDVSVLTEAIKSAGWMGRKRTVNIAEHIYKLPAHLVAPYAIADAIATLALYEDLNPVLDRENTRGAYRLECDLLPMVLEMRRRGIRVDLSCRRARPRPLLPGTGCRLCRIVGEARHACRYGGDRPQQVAGRNLRCPWHYLPAHGERESVVYQGLDAPA